MAEAITVARPYAQAAFLFASDHHTLKDWSEMLGLLAGIADDAEMHELVESPHVSADQLAGLFTKVGGERLNEKCANFVRVLAASGRLSLLPEIAAPEEMGRVSGYGWAIGTAGGIICLVLILPLIMFLGDTFADDTFIVRLSLVITAVFWAISAAPIFLWLTERAEARSLPPGENYLSVAFKQLRDTIQKAGRFKEFVKYMLAFLVYNDGVIMALNFAAIIGAVIFGLDQQMLIIFVIIVQVTNVVGAYLFGELVDRIGGKKTLILSILMMIGVVIGLYSHAAVGMGNSNPPQTGFFIIGAFAGFAMAGVQSVSRTMVAMFSPPGQSAEFYGFFSMTGRTSSFIGPAVYGWLAAEAALWYQAQGQAVVLAEQSGQRLAILSIGVFLLVGLAMLWFVNETKAREAAEAS